MHKEVSFSHKGVALVKTCDACPEQYDAFDGQGRMIGYLRLRHGRFTVDYPDVGGKNVYTAYPDGDGMFEENEREMYLEIACELLKACRKADDRR